MSWISSRSLLWTTAPSRRQVRPSTPSNGRPSAISRMVKSNSWRATKSTAFEACSAASGTVATWAPTRPTISAGLAALKRSATRMSERKVGALA